MRPRPRDESGSVAVLVAIMAAVMMGLAGLAVDLGHAFVVRGELQKRTDFAALAGGHGDNLPAPPPAGTCPYGARGGAGDPAVRDVAAYFGTRATNSTVTAGQLVDCDVSNGEVLYGSVVRSPATAWGFVFAYDKNQLTVISPEARVDFGFARVLGKDHVEVNGSTTAMIGSQGASTLPLYAFSGCDYGNQTIAQPTNGHAAADVLLSFGSDSNGATPDSLQTTPATNPARVPLGVSSPNNSLTISGTGGEFAGVTKVGFFESGTSGPGPAPVEVGTGGFTLGPGNNSVTVAQLPGAVTNVQAYWYVRVFKGATGKWSAVTTGNGNNLALAALPLRVGDPTLTCGQGSSAGNFGTLLLQNSLGPNGQSDNIAFNIATGLEHTLALFPNAQSNWLCSSSTTGAKLWPAEGTNCVDTKTGLDLAAARKGFVEGVAGKPGLLTRVGTGSGCAANGVPATRAFGAYTINNDTLTCFFTDDTTNLGQVNSSVYTKTGPVISSAIYASPRFVKVPVLGVQPGNGGSNKYQVVGIRPGFITDQPNSATRTTPATSTNGITGTGGNVDSIQVVFINEQALPPPPDSGGQLTTYQGGPKILRIVD